MHINVSSAKQWKECQRKAWYSLYPPDGWKIDLDPYEELIQQMGVDHEASILESLSNVITARGPDDTMKLMGDKIPVIYQAEYIDENMGLIGKPDFMVLHESGEYQVHDAKLASKLQGHDEILIQLDLYRRLSKSSLPPKVFLGDERIEEIPATASKKADQFLDSIQAIREMGNPPDVYYSYSKCSACEYQELCIPGFEKEENLGLVYGLDSRNIGHLKGQGIETISDLAALEPDDIPEVPYLKRKEARQRVGLQARSLKSGEVFRLSDQPLPDGTWVHFDIENNPLARHGNEVYLWGFLEPPYESNNFKSIWSDGGYDNDRQAWLDFLELVASYRRQYPDLVLAHYAQHERTTIKSCAREYEMEDDQRVQWLLGEDSPFFDMNSYLPKAWVLPVRSYGLKAVCKDERLVNFQWELKESGSQWSVVRFVDFLNATDDQERETIKQEILTYNRDDVKATRALEMWLRARE